MLIGSSVASIPASDTLSSKQRVIIEKWLAHNPEYRLAADTDCDCDDDIKQMRTSNVGAWKAIPDYHPYIATGDFNSDGSMDFAIVVINKHKLNHNYALVIFNGPFMNDSISPAYFKSGLDLKGQGLSYGPPRPKPYRLIIGPFESEGAILVPHGHTYKME